MKKLALILLAMAISLSLFRSNLAQAEEISITEQNVAQLHGEWEGEWIPHVIAKKRSFSSWQSELIVENDSLPLKVMLKYQHYGDMVLRPDGSGSIEEGKLLIKWEKSQWLRLTLYVSKSGEMKLYGDFYLEGDRGEMVSGQVKFVKK